MKNLPARRCFACLLILLVGLPAVAYAHPGHDGHDLTWDLSAGFQHPFSGLDHLIAMVAVGLWAAQLGGRARWLVPSAFVACMGLGAVFGHAGMMFSGVEQGVAASVLTLGLLIAASVRLSASSGATLAGLFAIFHGLAHGAEMPATGGAVGYASGFVLATVLLHAAGLAFGSIAQARFPRISQAAGWGVAVAGAGLFIF